MPLPNTITYNTEKMSHSCAEEKAQEHIEDHSALIVMPQMLSAQIMKS